MKKIASACFCCLWLYSADSLALTDDQVNAVRGLGELNGIALQCGYYEQTRVMKKNLVEAVPKRREFGQAFDEASNDSYLAFIENNQACPAAADLAESTTIRYCRDGNRAGSRSMGGASSNTAWALVPPIPKELTPARKGEPSRFHSAVRVFT